MDREAWNAVIHGVAKSRTWLSDWTDELNWWNLGKRYWWTCLHGRNWDTDIENRLVDTAAEGECGTHWASKQFWNSFTLLFCTLAKSCPTLWPHGLQHARFFCPSLSPEVCSNPCPLSWWCYLTISSSSVPFSCWFQSLPASRSFLMSQLCIRWSKYWSFGASASMWVLPMNIQG